MSRKETPGAVTADTRLNQIPVINVRGTNYEVGYTIGRQCKSLIEDVLGKWKYYNDVVVEKFQTPEGKHIYEGCLSLCNEKFPLYTEELKGMAEGAGVPFYKLFLLHIDSLIVPPEHDDENGKQKGQAESTTVMSNFEEVIIGHTVDASFEFLNNVFIISAQVLDSQGKTLEKFVSLTYAGYLPGCTMGYNHCGLIFSLNTIFPKVTLPDRTPRNFLGRAILKASNLNEVVDILRDSGHGTADGFSVNVHFAKQEGSSVLHNIEVGPQANPKESELSVLNLTHADHHVHCNKYLRLKIPELSGVGMESSIHRHKRIGRYLTPKNCDHVKAILSDESDKEYPVFRRGKKQDCMKTVAVGIFNVVNRQWSIYMESPVNSSPIAVLPIDI